VRWSVPQTLALHAHRWSHPRGILLIGPPGCGKTLLAKASPARRSLLLDLGSDFVEMFVGVGASPCATFKQARENSPCIIFLDEIDAVGRRRGGGLTAGTTSAGRRSTRSLVEMDGFTAPTGVIVVAATNRPDVLTPALLRRSLQAAGGDRPARPGGRGDPQSAPEGEGFQDVVVDTLARSTPGYSGADTPRSATRRPSWPCSTRRTRSR
jgi:cell division protease FtsH